MSKDFKRTLKQIEQTAVLSGPHRHAMSYGGSRSGKTFGLVRALVIRAMKCRSRHLALRLKFNHAKTSLWYETFPKVFKLCFPGLKVIPNKTDYFYLLPNGSEIWCGGLDESERVEKILGKEYSTIFFNECSQIPYSSVSIALTRLAEKNELKKRAWYDENPPTKRHWSYPLFVKGLDPETWEPRPDAENYTSILMNPSDNIENIDSEYLSGVLELLPERERNRFMLGIFGDDSNGNIYYAFKRHEHVREVERVPNIPLTIGMDFNVSPMTAVICQIVNDSVHVLDEVYLDNSHTDEMGEHLNTKWPGRWTVIPDATGKALKTSAAGKSDHHILKARGFNIPFVQNPFRMDRYNEVNALLEKGRLIIHPKCVKLIKDLEQVAFKEGTNLPDTKDAKLTHISDALGYLVHWAFPLVKINQGISMVAR
jgi:PBSX family phage terminase large subunit